jgi:hypothetical protein
VIVADESCGSYITAEQCLRYKQGLLDVAYRYHVGADVRRDARVGIVVYGALGSIRVNLAQGTSMSVIIDAVMAIRCDITTEKHNLADAVSIAIDFFALYKRINPTTGEIYKV